MPHQHPTFDIEGSRIHLEQVRTRRLLVVYEYQQSMNIKLSAEHNKLKTKLDKQLTMLSKDILRLDKLLEKCEKRTNLVQELTNEDAHLMELLSND